MAVDGAGQSRATGAMLTPAASSAIIAAVIIGALFVGREIFVPIALAILMSFVLAPAVGLLERWRFPTRGQPARRRRDCVHRDFCSRESWSPRKSGNSRRACLAISELCKTKIDLLRSVTTAGPLERAADVLQNLGKEISRPQNRNEPATAAPTVEDIKPIPVEVRSPPPTALENISSLISPLLHPLATIGVVIVFVVFILFQREDLRNRVIKLAGSHDLQATTAALDDAGSRLSRLFLTQVALNTAFGIVIGLGLWMIGVPSAILWGIMAAILRFVPYIGIFIAAFFPLALAVAVDPGWSMLIWAAALIIVTELVVGNAIEPMLYGHSSGLSPVAVVVSATFWTALWGPIGLVLATPLTVCLVVLGRHVERLEFIDILFGDRPALSPPEIFYQRILANDPAEAIDKAEAFLKERSLSEYYEEVALRGLRLAQNDLKRELLAPSRLDGNSRQRRRGH